MFYDLKRVQNLIQNHSLSKTENIAQIEIAAKELHQMDMAQ
jgi:hypothetical protein